MRYHSEVPEEDVVRDAEEVSGRGVPAVGPAEGGPYFGKAPDAGSRVHIGCDPRSGSAQLDRILVFLSDISTGF